MLIRVCVCVCVCLYLNYSVFSGITTTGSTLSEYQFYVSAYEVLYSHDGQQWNGCQEVGSDKNKVCLHHVTLFCGPFCSCARVWGLRSDVGIETAAE